MEINYETLKRCNNCRFEAKRADGPVHGIIYVRNPDEIVFFFTPEDETMDWFQFFSCRGHRYVTYAGKAKFEFYFSLEFSDFKVIPRDPEKYKDWQVGDRVAMPGSDNDNNYTIIIFRAGELVVFKKPTGDGRWEGYSPYTCEELFEKGWRLILTDVEKEILAERESADKNAVEDMRNEVADDVRELIAKELDGYTPKGKLEGFPVEIVAKMLERQYEQTGKVNVKVFEKSLGFGNLMGGFNWEATIEGERFWEIVLSLRKFRMFFKLYPKENRCQLKRFDAVLVRDGDEDKWIPAVLHFVDSSALYPFSAVDGIAYKHCAPLNEDTLRYLRTKEQIPGAL